MAVTYHTVTYSGNLIPYLTRGIQGCPGPLSLEIIALPHNLSIKEPG